MLRTIAIFHLCFCFSVSSIGFAQGYTCNDREYLRGILEQLDRDCGGSGYCTALDNRYIGDDAVAVVDECDGQYPRISCIESLVCDASVPYCTAIDRFIGKDAREVMDECLGSYSRPSCVGELECHGPVSYCKTLGLYAGNSATEVVDECDQRFSRSQCIADLECF